MEGNHPNVAEAKNKRKVTNMAEVRTHGCDEGREICEKRDIVPKLPPKKTTTSPSQLVRKILRHSNRDLAPGRSPLVQPR